MFKSPWKKLVRFFEKSRDGWKRKCQQAKRDVQRWTNQARAVARSRDEWRRRAEASGHELEALKAEFATLQKTARG